ncbi:hypothetical protein FZC66_04360 [Priestia megaterium]|nr:hypothetical protein FZC66_04360 [Priestia megaterium]
MNKKKVSVNVVGTLFDLYADGLIKKETFDECVEAYKDYKNEQAKAVDESSNQSSACTKKHLSDIIDDIVKQMSDWSNNRDSKYALNGIDYGELIQLVNILHDKNFMAVHMFEDLIRVLTEHHQHSLKHLETIRIRKSEE